MMFSGFLPEHPLVAWFRLVQSVRASDLSYCGVSLLLVDGAL
jgi:hypothetical protein